MAQVSGFGPMGPCSMKETAMRTTFWKALAGVIAFTALTGCGGLLVGAGGAVVADGVAEEEQGGDGLF